MALTHQIHKNLQLLATQMQYDRMLCAVAFNYQMLKLLSGIVRP